MTTLIAPLSTPPSRQDPANFAARGDVTMAELPIRFAQANAQAIEINEHAETALSAVDLALANGHYKGRYSTLSGAMDIPASVYDGGYIWMLLENTANIAADVPGVSVKWLKIESAGNLGTAAYTEVGDYQPNFGALSGIVVANGAGVVSAANAAQIAAVIGATPVQNANNATLAGACSGNAATADLADVATLSGHATVADSANAIADGVVSTTAKIADNIVTPAKLTQKMTRAAVVAASGSIISFTSVPSWAKVITVMLDQVSMSGAVMPLIRIGTGGVLEVDGYIGAALYQNATAISNGTMNPSGFDISNASSVAGNAYSGSFVLRNIAGNTWIISGSQSSNTGGLVGGCNGSKTLSGVLDMISLVLTTTSFDGGQVNIVYEG